MKLKITAFGIARDILQNQTIDIIIPGEATVGVLKNKLEKAYPEFSKLTSLSFAVREEYQEDDFSLSDGDEVVIIPPVSGG